MMTASGIELDPFLPSADKFHLPDVAWGLAHTCRFGGHVRRYYSVAQHCVHVSRTMERFARARAEERTNGSAECSPKSMALMGLLHDAPEAYLSDHIRPVKDRVYIRVDPGYPVQVQRYYVTSGEADSFHVVPVSDIEDAWWDAIAASVGMGLPARNTDAYETLKRECAVADRLALLCECALLRPSQSTRDIPPLDARTPEAWCDRIEMRACASPRDAYDLYMDRFCEIEAWAC